MCYYSPYREALRHIFMNNAKLRDEVEKDEIVNIDAEMIRVDELREKALEWDFEDRFLLDLALHLYDCSEIEVDLGNIDYLSKEGSIAALNAIRIRFNMD